MMGGGVWKGAFSPDSSAFKNAALGALMLKPSISAPTEGATGVSRTPTVTSAKQEINHHIFAKLASNTAISASEFDVPFDTVVVGNIGLAAGVFTLTAGKTYLLEAALYNVYGGGGGDTQYRWFNSDTGLALTNGSEGSVVAATSAADAGGNESATLVYTPATTHGVKVRTTQSNSSGTIYEARSYARITQLGEPAIAYVFDKLQVQIRVTSSGVVVYTSGEVAALSDNVSPALAASTAHQVRVRHKSADGVWTSWSDWVGFTTTS